jgi:putative hydrolase of the HAD superfamily
MKSLIDLYGATDWVFDLDNTLYPAECDLFPQIQVKMNDYVAKFLNLPHDEARLVQKKYYVEYGTTLNGLMIHHEIDPHDYLHHVHDIDYSTISPNLPLREAIENLPARKIVFTNGSKKHAQNAIAAMGLDGVFHDIIDIAGTDFTPKPHKKAFVALLAAHNVNPKTSVMVEDLSKNLVTAKEMGFATILVWSNKIWHDEPKGHAPAGQDDALHEHIDFDTNNLTQFIEAVLKAAK